MHKQTLKLFSTIFFLLIANLTYAQMSGTYTIDKSKSGTRNYKNFNAAVTSLNSSGVSGPVVFKVANDTYTEQVSLLYVSGSSSTNTITFEGNDSSKVILQYDCSQYEAVVKINAAANFVFKSLTIKSTNNTYGYGVHITSSAENITVTNCIVAVAERSGVGADCIPINIAGGTYGTYGDNGEKVTIRNSILRGGYFGLNIRGTNNSLLSEEFNIENNQFIGQYVYPIYAVFAKDLNIINNIIDSTILYYAYGIYTNQCAGGEISYNRIYAGRFGLYLYLHNYYNRSDSIVVTNNEISDFDDASYQSGIFSSATFNLKAYHNTISTNGTVSSFSYSAFYIDAPYNHTILNNNIKASGNSAVFYLGAGSLGSTYIDYNNYHAGANGSLISWQGTSYNKLGDLKTDVSTQNQNSITEDPLFVGSRNLIPEAPGINNRALNGIGGKDLNGNARPKAPDNVSDIGAYEFYIAPKDIDLITISNPVIAKTGKNEVAVVIKNNGSSAFKDTVFIQYRIDNGSWVKDTAVYTNLKIGATDTFFFTKKWTIASAGTFDVCATISPMLATDPDSLVGDTICETKCVGRSGTFTIDITGNGDYRTFTQAINSLSCGIAGPIKFVVKPGTYVERLTLTAVTGATAQNTIVFEGTDRDKVFIKYDGTSSLPATVLFDDAKYITFKDVTILNQGDQVSCGFWLRETSSYNTIEGCKILLDSTTANYATAGILIANSTSSSAVTIPGNSSENLLIKNNIIVGGSHGIRVNGTGYATVSKNILIQNNTIRKFYYQGINAAYIGTSKIRKNHISSPRITTAYGLAVYYSNNDSIDANYIEGGRFGLYVYYENTYNRNTFSSIANNMITNLVDPNYQIGLYTYLGYNLSIYHNSIWTTGTYSNPYYAGMNIYYCYNSFAKNNSIKAENGMVFSKYYGTISIGAIDYNNYYGTGAAKYYFDGLTFTDLSTWKSIKSQFNQKSNEGNPNYNSLTDLHASGAQLNNAGVKGLGINTDYDGHKRPFSPDKKIDIGADEYYVSPYDLDLVSLDSPIVPIIGQNDIRIVLKNSGIKKLDDDTAVVSYSVDGKLEVRDTIIIKSLDPNDTYIHTFSKKWAITKGASYLLCAQLDTFYKPDPDTLTLQKKCVTMCPGAKGTYTIDRTGGGDFKTFRGAVNALACGVNGPVTFIVKNGYYNERLKLGEIIGASATNTITFLGESRGGTILNYTGALDSMEVVHMEGADYFSFRNMTFKNNSTVYSRGVRISNAADHNTFKSITFDIPLNALNGYCMSVYISDAGLSTIGNAGNYNVFNNCSFQGGYYGARLDGIGTTSLNYGNEFVKCNFLNHRVFGIYAIYQGEMNIESCLFDSLSLDYYQMYIYMCSETSLKSNIVRDGRYGIYLLYENYYFQEETSVVINNMVSDQSYSVDNYAMNMYICYNLKFFHNSAMLNQGNTGSAVIFNSGSGHDVRNNSFAKSTNGDLFTNTNSSFSEIDFNNYYIGTSKNFVTYNGTSYDNLTKWKSAVSGFNRNSREGDPGYNSAIDLSIDPKSQQLANWGSVTTGVTTDYEGDIRNPQSPDIGADEYSDLYDIGVATILNPTSQCELSNKESITIEVENKGNIEIPSGELIPVAYKIDAGATRIDTFILSSKLSKNSKVQFTFKVKADFSSFKSYRIKCWTDISNDSLRTNDTLTLNRSSYENPTANFNVSGLACSTEGVQFNDASTTTVATINNYSWTFGNSASSNSKNPSTSYTNSGNYSVKLVTTTTDGCLDSITKTVTVYDKPTAGFASSKLCFGDSATFTNTSSIATATGASFLWDFDDTNNSTARNPKHKYGSAADYDVELIATNSDGCKDTVVNTIQVSPNPVSSFTLSNSCKGDSSTFTNTSTVPIGYTPTYNWTFGDGNSSTKENPKYLYGAIGTYTVALTASLSNGCSSASQNPINIYSKPQPAFTVNDGCQKDSIAFTNNSVIQLDTISAYNWSFGDGNTSTKIAPKNLYLANNTYSVKLVLTSIKGCKDSLSKSLTINEKPDAGYSVSDVCSNDSSKFLNSSSITVGSINAQTWSFGDGFKSTLVSPIHKYSTYGSYNTSLIITSDKGCKDTAVVQTTVNASPKPDFSAPNVCFGSKLFVSNKSTISSGSIVKYNWDLGDGNTSTQINPTHTYLSKDTFTIKVEAISNKGCVDSIKKDVIIDSKIIPDFSTTNLCLGDSTSFSNSTNISCGSVIGYLWDFGDGNTSSIQNPNHKFANSGSYKVKLVVIQAASVKDSVTKTVIINPLPKPNFSTTNVCTNDSTTFTNTSSIASGSIASYNWSFGDGNKSNSLSPKHAYATNNTYLVKLIATSNKGCIESNAKSITVYELPKTSFTVSSACLGKGVNFSNKSTIGSGTLTYSWQFGDGFSSTQKNPSYSYSKSGIFTVKLTSTSNNSCATVDSQKVTIHPKPSANFSASNQCSNKSISFSNSSTISAGTISYLWKFGDKTTSTAINPQHQYKSAGTYSVTLIVTSNNNCVDSITKNVSALPTPVANFAVPSPCSGTNITFTNASSISTGTMSYAWDFGDGKTSTATSPSHNYSATGTYQVKLITTASSGCKDSITKTVNVYDIPTASFTVTGRCLTDSIKFGNTSTIGAGTMTFEWDLGDGTTSTKSSINHKYLNAGTYQVKMIATSNGGCKDSSTQSISIYPTPSAAFSNLNVCLGSSNTFSNSSTISSGSLTYFWDFDNGMASTAKNPTITYASGGTYNVKLIATSNQGCSDSAVKQVEVYINPKSAFAYANTCLDDTTVFTNNSTLSQGTMTFLWNFDDSNTSSLKNSKNKYAQTGAYLVELITTSNNGCQDTSTRLVNINPKAKPAFGATNVCLGQEVSFNNKSSLSKGSFANSWTFGDGNTASINNPDHQYAQIGTYLATLTLTTDSGCISRLTKAIIVNDKPIAGFISNNICVTDSASFGDTSKISTGKIVGYNWAFGDGFKSVLKSPTHLYANRGLYNVQLIIESDSGCSDTISKGIQVYATPRTSFSVSNVCFGDTLYPSNNSTIASGTISNYNWNFGDGNTSTSATPLNYYSKKGTYDIKLVSTSNNGCKDSLTKQVTVDNVIIPGFVFNNACLGEKVDFTNTTNASCGNISSYQWSFGDGSISSQASPSHSFKTAGIFDVRLIVTEKAGRKDTLIKKVTIYPNPTVQFSINDTCAGSAPTFNNTSTISSGSISSYVWTFGDGTKGTSSNPTHIYNNQGTYTIKLVAQSNYGCSDSTTMNVEIFELPTVDFSAVAGCEYDSVVFNNKTSISSGTLNYAWQFGDLSTNTAKSPKYKYATAGKYNVTLTVESVNGCKSAKTNSVFVNYKPVASIIGDSVCIGENNSFTNNSSITKGAIASYNWKFGDGFSSSLASPSHNYSSDGNYSVSLIIESDSGCFDTAFTNAGVHPAPTVSFTASNVCLGDDLKPVNKSSISSGTISNWDWSFGDGSGSSSQNPSNTYANKGTYSIKLVATSNYGCADSLTRQVVVDNVIIAGFTTQDICLGDTAFFANTTNTSCGTISGYQWDFGDGSGATTKSPFRIFKAAGTYTVSLIVVQAGGNRDTAKTTIVVSPKPKVNFFANNDCAKEQIQFQNLSTIASGSIATYVWDFNDGTKDSDKNPKHTYTTNGSYQVKLIAKSTLGCIDSVSKNLTIYEVPVVSFSANDVCFNENVVFKNGSSIGSGPMSYAWTFGDGFSSSQKDPTYKYAKPDNYSVTLKVTSNNFCEASTTKNIKVFELPNIQFSIEDTCALDVVKLSNSSSITNGTLTYNWDFGNGSNSNAKSPILSYSNDGNYTVKLKATSNSSCADSLSKTISIFEKPSASFTYKGTCPDAPMTFTNTSTPSSIISGQQWLFNGTDASTASQPQYTFGTAGPHTVVLSVTSNNNCIDTATRQVSFQSVPVASFSFNTACERDTVWFTNNSQVQKGTIDYNWNFGDGNTSILKDPSHQFNGATNFDVKLVATSDAGCSDSLVQSILPLNKPEVNFKESGACLGDTIYFQNLSSNDQGNTFKWFLGISGVTDTLSNSKYLYTTTGSYDVSLKVTATNNCADSITKTIKVAEGPKNLNFTFNNSCARTKVKFTNQTKNPNLTFKWVFFDGSYSTQRDPEKFYPKAGEYPIGFEAREGDCADSAYKTITIYPYADSSFTFTGLGNREVSFEPNDSDIHTYNWDFGDGNVSTDYAPTNTYAKDGNYKVILSVVTSNGCRSISERQVIVKGSSISWLSNEDLNFNVFPNPFKDFVNATFEVKKEGHVHLVLYNELGQVVTTAVNQSLPEGKYQYLLVDNTAKLTGGMYYVRLVINDQVIIKPIVLQR